MIGKTAIGTSSTEVSITGLSTHSKVILCNDSDTIIYVSLNGTAELNKGIRLNANGDRITIEAEPNGTTNVRTIFAISASANKNLSYCVI